MKVYQISYDLKKRRSYSAFYKRLRSYGIYCHVLESSWVIVTDQNAVPIRDYLAQAMDPDDGLLVTRLQGEAAWRGLGAKLSQWLETELGGCFA